MTEPTDKELMVAVQNGAVEKLGDLFERHHSRIYSFCLRLTGKAEDSERLRKALTRLPPAGREVLVLSRFEHCKYEEIGQILGCSVGAVKTRAPRALKPVSAARGGSRP